MKQRRAVLAAEQPARTPNGRRHGSKPTVHFHQKKIKPRKEKQIMAELKELQ